MHWFNILDSLDGCRARRLKCGSGVGRIVDEAGDAVIYTLISGIMGYIYKLPPGFLCCTYAFVNLPKYVVEVYFYLTGKFVYCDDFFGPLEANFWVASTYFIAGVFGQDAF